MAAVGGRLVIHDLLALALVVIPLQLLGAARLGCIPVPALVAVPIIAPAAVVAPVVLVAPSCAAVVALVAPAPVVLTAVVARPVAVAAPVITAGVAALIVVSPGVPAVATLVVVVVVGALPVAAAAPVLVHGLVAAAVVLPAACAATAAAPAPPLVGAHLVPLDVAKGLRVLAEVIIALIGTPPPAAAPPSASVPFARLLPRRHRRVRNRVKEPSAAIVRLILRLLRPSWLFSLRGRPLRAVVLQLALAVVELLFVLLPEVLVRVFLGHSPRPPRLPRLPRLLHRLGLFGLLGARRHHNGGVLFDCLGGCGLFGPLDDLKVLDHVDLEDDGLDGAFAGRHVGLALRLAAFRSKGAHLGEVHGALFLVDHDEGAFVADFCVGDERNRAAHQLVSLVVHCLLIINYELTTRTSF